MKVCSNCFNDIELKQFILANSSEVGLCEYCNNGEQSQLIEIEELLDSLAELINVFIPFAEGKPLLDTIQIDWNLFSENSNSRKLLDDLLNVLGKQDITSLTDVLYLEEITDCVSYWDSLKQKIKWENRFLTNTDKLEELHWDRLFKKSVIISNHELFYRARLHNNDNQIGFDLSDMGTPERNKTMAGRANPQGIPYLYLSRNIETTLYEIRASFLDEVSIGTFKVKDDAILELVDFTESISAFDDSEFNLTELVKSRLLKRLISQDLSKPIRRYDSELEYIPTQFICEYIKYLYPVDGIIFDSSLHNGGKNLVLFSQDKVECVEVSKHRVSSVEIQSLIIH